MARVLFLQKDVFAKPAIMLLSAILQKAGHSCELLIQDLEKDMIGTVLAAGVDIVAFSVTTGEYLWMKEIGRAIRPHFKGLMICGGAHPTFFPEVINDDYLDAICTGEGDEAMRELANAWDKGGDLTSIPNVSLKRDGRTHNNPLRPLITDLDALPFYNRSIYHRYSLYQSRQRDLLYYDVVITGRGCPYGCSFCFNKLYNHLYQGKGKICRRRSVSNVIEELKEMKRENKHLRFITFDDDIFTLPPRQWVVDLLDEYRKVIGIPFKMNTRANLLDEDLVRRLKDAGCHAIKIGVESGSEYIRNTIYFKGVSNQDIIQAAALTKQYRLQLQTFNTVGAPGETLETALETFDLNRRIRPAFVWCSLLNPYPGTAIFDYCVKNKYLDKAFSFRDIGYSYFTGSPLQLTNKREIINLQRLMNIGVMLRVPKGLMRALIKLPLPGLYKLMFGGGFVIGIKRINNSSLWSTVKLAITHLVKYNL